MVNNLFLALILFHFSNPEIQIKILDNSIQSGKNINIEIFNNTDENYCLILDTTFYHSKDEYHGGKFINLKTFLKDNKNNWLPIINDIIDNKNKNISNTRINNKKVISTRDTLVVNEYKKSNLVFYKLLKRKSLKIKVPFYLVVKYSTENVYQYYELNHKLTYKGNVTYLLDNEFIKKNCSLKKIDSIKKKGFKIFLGELNSNEVPLIW